MKVAPASLIIDVLRVGVMTGLLAGAFIGCASGDHTAVLTPVTGLLDRIDQTNEINAAYGVYPPYTEENPNTKAVSGFSVDVIDEIGRQLHAKVIWHRMNWNTMAADLKRGEFDVIADPIFQTIPRAREFEFSNPYSYFADGIVVVRKSDERFKHFKDLDNPTLTVAVGQGWASETLVRSELTHARVRVIETTTDLLSVFNEVLSGRADAAVADGADAERFVREHRSAAKALFLNAPPAAMPAGFALRPTDERGAAFLNVALRNLASTGVLDALRRKYSIQDATPASQYSQIQSAQ